MAGTRLYTFGISGILSRSIPARAVIWRKQFAKEFDAIWPDFGTATSPVVDDGLVIVRRRQQAGALTALDAETGAAKWMWKGDGPHAPRP